MASTKNKDCMHAEVDCVSKLKKSNNCSHINLFVFRTNNKGDKLMMAKPCENCIRTIDFTLKKKNYKLKKILYTNEDGNIVYLTNNNYL
jgi:hypothetical protein